MLSRCGKCRAVECNTERRRVVATYLGIAITYLQ